MALVETPPGGILLDAGGGTGRVAQYLRDKAALLVVADESTRMLAEAGKKEGLRPICSHTEQMPFGDGIIDKIIMVDALHHVADQTHTAHELWRILKPGGRIIIEEPNIQSFRVKLIAIAEKLAFMRSNFLAEGQITRLFYNSHAAVRTETDGLTLWIIIEKALEFSPDHTN